MSSLSELRKAKTAAERDLKQYKKRLSEIKDVQGKLMNGFDDNIEGINRRLEEIIEQENEGFQYHSHVVRTLGDVLEQKAEKSVSIDAYMKTVGEHLVMENKDISKKIDELEQKIRDLEQQIDEAEEEERKEAQEKLKGIFSL